MLEEYYQSFDVEIYLKYSKENRDSSGRLTVKIDKNLWLIVKNYENFKNDLVVKIYLVLK